MKADLYSLTPNMMKIADNPTDPWLDEHLRSEGLVPYKFGQPRAKQPAKQDVAPISIAPASGPKAKDLGQNQNLVDYLADKVKE